MSDIPFASLGTAPSASIVSAATTLQEFAEAGIDYSSFFQRANSFKCSIGPDPGIGWVLMTKSELTKLDSRQPQNLTFGLGSASITINNLAIIQAQRILSGASLDPDSLYLVQLSDVRWFLKRTYINARYNIRETCDASAWCTGTLKTAPSTPWTFAEICEDIWLNFSSFGGFFTGNSTWSASKLHEIASTVDPENLRFEGISAWDALAQLCQQCGFFLRYDPLVGDIRIMKVGLSVDPAPAADGDLHSGYGGALSAAAPDVTFQSSFALTPNCLVRTDNDALNEDSETIFGSPMIPASVNVVFPTNDADCGSFCDIDENHGWYHKINITAATVRATLTGNSYKYLDHTTTGTSVVLNSTTYARFATATDADPSNVTDLTTLATQIATDYYTSLGYQANGRIVFGGVKSFVPGPYISEVTWREYGDGMKTEVARWPVTVGLAKVPKVPTGGGAAGLILFTLTDVDCANSAATGNPLKTTCGGSLPEDGQYIVDDMGCMLVGNDALLIGRKCWCQYTEGDVYDCEYSIVSMCCPDTSCG